MDDATPYEKAVEVFQGCREQFEGQKELYARELCPINGNPERLTSMNLIMFRDVQGWKFNEPIVKVIVEGFEREVAEESTTLYLLHDGEAEAREVDSWSRFIAYQALEFFEAVVCEPWELRDGAWRDLLHGAEYSELSERDRRWRDLLHKAKRLADQDGAWREWLCRASATLDKRTVNRPAGRRDARQNLGQDFLIVSGLIEAQERLPDCGLDVTSSKPCGSLAAAMAEAWDISEYSIVKAWRDANPLLRPDRQRKDRRCASCGGVAGRDARRIGEEGDLLCRACSGN